MNILHLTNRDKYGAGKAAYRLHLNLLNHGYNSKILVIRKTLNDENIISILPLKFVYKFIMKIKVLMQTYLFNPQNSDKNYYFEDQRFSSFHYQIIKKKIPFIPDIIIVHWISAFINFKQLYLLQKETNALIIFHLVDMALITGGCHYAWDCINYKKSCGNCPGLLSKSKYDLSSKVLQYKEKYIEKLNCIVITPTQWLYNQARQSTLFKKIITKKILIGINEEVFTPERKNNSRSALGIPNHHKSILIGTITFNEKRKGSVFLIKALEVLVEQYSINANEITLVIAGNDFPDNNGILEKFNLIKTGYADTDYSLADLYAAADLFVSASIEDSGPMMINESIISGTPVVAFDMGVTSDLVINDKTGYIAKNMDSADLAYGINKIIQLNESQTREYSKNCRELGLQMCSYKIQEINFKKLIQEKITKSEY